MTDSPQKDVHILIPETCLYVTFHGKTDFAGVIKLRALKQGDFLGYLGGSQGSLKEGGMKVRMKIYDDGSRNQRDEGPRVK